MVFVKKNGDKADSMCMVTLQLIIGGILLMIGGKSVEDWSIIEWRTPFIWNLLFISIFNIGLGWLAYFSLVALNEASEIASYTFLIPNSDFKQFFHFTRTH
jgi:drug/metabolite transporter (DMT)-like permease